MSINQLLHNYLFELKKKLEHLPSNNFGTIEFTNEEIRRVKNAINRGDPDYKIENQNTAEKTKQNPRKKQSC